MDGRREGLGGSVVEREREREREGRGTGGRGEGVGGRRETTLC